MKQLLFHPQAIYDPEDFEDCKPITPIFLIRSKKLPAANTQYNYMENIYSRKRKVHPVLTTQLLGLWRYVMVLGALFFLAAGSAVAQDPGVGGTRAGFEIDADFKSGFIPPFWNATNYTPFPFVYGDDWSKGPTGNAVLKQEGGVSVPGITADRRGIWQVDGNSGTAAPISLPELSVFNGSSNKNGDNIAPGASPYSVGPGSTPQKNDITNTYLHGRPDPITGNTWVFFGAETRSTSGASYLDFEYNQAGVQVASNQLQGLGLVNGRTVNDLLLVINYTGGGNKPEVGLRKWQADGTWSDEVALGDGNAFITTNAADVAAVAPNRAFTGDGAFSNVTSALQFVEGGINISYFLPNLAGIDPCNPQSTVTVKTRSSPSYTSELKDYDILRFSITPPAEATVAAITPQCPNPNGTNVFDISGTYVGTNPVWSVVGGTLSDISYVNGVATAKVSVTGVASATVTLTVQTDNPACVRPASASRTATVNAAPMVNAGVDKVINCNSVNGQVTLIATANPAGTYLWTAANGGTIVGAANELSVAVSSAGTYTFTSTTANGCSASDAAVVTEDKTPPVVNAGADKVINCNSENGQTTLTATSSPTGTYLWTASNGGTIVGVANELTVIVSSAGTYTFTSTTTNGCSASDAASVTEDKTPPIVNAGTDKVITCNTPNGQITLTATSSPAGTYLWTASNGGNIVGTANGLSVEVSSAGTYTFTSTTANGCFASDVAVVTQDLGAPTVNAGADKVINCNSENGQTTLTATSSPTGTYLWTASNGGTIVGAANELTVIVSSAGTYTFNSTTANGCATSDAAVVTEDKTPPGVNAGLDKVINCTTPNGQITLTATSNPAGTYLWTASNGGTIVGAANALSVMVSSAGTYTFRSTTANGCFATDAVSVTEDKTPPTVNAGTDKVITCTTPNGQITLTATSSPAGTYLWTASNGGAIVGDANGLSVVVSSAGTYTFSSTTANGCAASDAAVVTQDLGGPMVNAGADKVINCNTPNGQVTLTATSTPAAGTYLWTAGNGGTIVGPNNGLSVVVSSVGTYTFTSTAANGCSASDAAMVTENKAAPSGMATGGALSCTTGSFTLSSANVTAGATQTWYGPAALGGANGGKGPVVNNLSVSTMGTYTLVITNPTSGCFIQVAVEVTPAVNCVLVEGCTIGYWKNHTNRWCNAYTPSMVYKTVFRNAPASIANLTLLQALNLGGGGINNLARQSVAALLNICSSEVAYNSAYPSTSSLVTAVNAAYLSTNKNAAGTLATTLDTYNNAGCPLGGTSATKVVSKKYPAGGELLAPGSATNLSAYPNPYTDKATIEFTLEEAGDFDLVLYDVKGSVVKQIGKGKAVAGKLYSFEIGHNNMPEGIYLARLSTNKFNKVIRISLRK